jgi:heme-degrading monooxygenase HmoA
MDDERSGTVAVIFTSRRTGEDEAGYARAAAAMDALAAAQPGYRGVASARGDDGVGITVSYWADEAAAVAWRAQAEHAAVREQGRARWYSWYSVEVATIGRAYRWTRP